MLIPIIVILSLIALVPLIYAYRIEANWYDITEPQYHIDNLDAVFDGYRIAHISDIHMDGWTKTAWLHDVIERVNAQHPDLIVITGDFVTRSARKIDAQLWTVLANLQAPDGVYCVLGNHDYLGHVANLRDILRDIGIQELANDCVRIERNHAHFYLAGVDNVTEHRADLTPILAKMTDDAPAILLAHEPDFADFAAAANRFAIQLSGHTHGGQIVFPIIGIIYKPYLGKKYLYGLHRLPNKLQLYVTRGVGTVGLPLRFNCRPEITILSLHPTKN